MVSSLRNVFGGKATPEVTPVDSPDEPSHAAFSAHAQLTVQSNNGHTPLSNESIEIPNAPNPQYSPRERLASTSMLEELSDSPHRAQTAAAQQVQAGEQRAQPMQHASQLATMPSVGMGAGNDMDSCTSAASVAFASKSLARNHAGVLIPQSQARSQGPHGPPAHLLARAAASPSSGAPQHAEVTSGRAAQTQQLANPVGQSDMEAAADKNSGGSTQTTSVEISPPSEPTTATPLLPPRAAPVPKGMLSKTDTSGFICACISPCSFAVSDACDEAEASTGAGRECWQMRRQNAVHLVRCTTRAPVCLPCV